jgi:hypothetical protein
VTYWQRPDKKMSHGLPSGKPLGCLAELLRLDLTVHPPVENIDHRCARLQALGANRTDSICRYVCL